MPLFKKEKTIVHFIHIPKSAGTSVQELFLSNGFEVFLFNRKADGTLPCCPQHFHKKIYDYLGISNVSDYEFSIVRSPLSRLISEYKFRRLNDSGYDFNAFVIAVFFIYKFCPYILDNHIRPQSEFVSNNTKIFKYEDGVEEVQQYFVQQDLLNSGAEIPHIYKTDAIEIKIDARTMEKIHAFYEKDYKGLNYDNESVSLLSKRSVLQEVSLFFKAVSLGVRLVSLEIWKKSILIQNLKAKRLSLWP